MPGVPGFVQRLARGHATTERKCLPAGQTIAALLAPNPKAQCHVDTPMTTNGRYEQTLTCPQKQGSPLTVTRSGVYDASGFRGRAFVTGATKKGPMSIILDQRASRSPGTC